MPDNPLQQTSGLPRFDQIQPSHVAPAVEQLLAVANARFTELEASVEPTWESLVDRFTELDIWFEQTWGPIGHLLSVMNSAELRTAYESVLESVVAFGLKSRQSEPIYNALKSLRESVGWENLESAQKRILTERLRDMELSGIGLTGEKRERFNAISQRLSKLSSDYSNHVLDATKAYSLIITNPDDLKDTPLSLRRLASGAYNQTKAESDPASTPDAGPWKITLEMPIFDPFIKHCSNRELRRDVYMAYISRASSGEFDNTPLCEEILSLRLEKAQLLGFQNFAEMSLSEKMAEKPQAVFDMLEDLRAPSWEPAIREKEELNAYAAAHGGQTPLSHWDIAFWSERMREDLFEFKDEDLRPYFPHEKVLDGLFHLIEHLFGVRIVSADGTAPVWQKDVRFFHVNDAKSGRHVASFYYDPYSRPETKRPGAWMGTCLQKRDSVGQLPVAYLVCNCTPPAGDHPSLMNFREVETLFHEFGHGLQHMLSTVAYTDASGISGIEWDAVELPSQFMENWCYHQPTITKLTAHVETGEPLPDRLFEKIVASRNYRAASMMLRQITFGMTDMRLHSTYTPHPPGSGQATGIFEIQKQVMAKTSTMPMLPEDRSLCSFQHIFSGGYSAGYYSYKWAEVLSADAFQAFVEAGLDDAEAMARVGHKFRDTVLSQGGSRHPMDVFVDFRGRQPDPLSLLKQYNLIAT